MATQQELEKLKNENNLYIPPNNLYSPNYNNKDIESNEVYHQNRDYSKYISLPQGINEEVVKCMSFLRGEPPFLLKFRLRAFQKWRHTENPTWCPIDLPYFHYEDISYFTGYKLSELEKVDQEVRERVHKQVFGLPYPLRKVKKATGEFSTEVVLNSSALDNPYFYELRKQGIILCSISRAIRKYFPLVSRNLGQVIPVGDNFYASLNSAIFTDGSFVYIPKNLRCPADLGTFFKVSNDEIGQYERTLIVAESGSYVSYIEGCTAPRYSINQFHAAVVELVAKEDAEIKYSTVQNWFSGDLHGNGGIYNLVTKRGLCLGKNSKISWTQFETGAGVTWKYPGCVLLGKNSVGEFFSATFTGRYQHADSGAKMYHLGSNTKSQIISRGISVGNSINTYRGLIKIGRRAFNTKSFSQCDSVLYGKSISNTFPTIEVQNSTACVEHEATAGKVSEEQIFYLMQRGYTLEQAISTILCGFCRKIFSRLPAEFSFEADYVLMDKLEGGVG